MAATTVSPNNTKLAFKGKPMAKSKSKSADAPASIASSAPEKDYEAEDALRTMQRAEEHQRDPKMMKRVGTVAKKQADGLGAVMAKLQKQGLVSDKQAAKASEIANRRKAARA